MAKYRVAVVIDTKRFQKKTKSMDTLLEENFREYIYPGLK